MGLPPIRAPDGPDVNIGKIVKEAKKRYIGKYGLREGGSILRVVWTLYGITLIVVLLRLYTQVRVMKQLGLGDALMTASLVSWLPFSTDVAQLLRLLLQQWSP